VSRREIHGKRFQPVNRNGENLFGATTKTYWWGFDAYHSVAEKRDGDAQARE